MRNSRQPDGRATAFISRGSSYAIGFILPLLLLSLDSGLALVQAVTITNCTQTNLVVALQSGEAYFPSNCSITLTSPIVITNDNTVIRVAAGKSVTLTGSNGPLLSIAADIHFDAGGLTLTGGRSTAGGAIFINSGATVLLTNCNLSGNTAAGTPGLDGTVGPDSSDGNGGNGASGTSGSPARGGAIYNLGTLTLINCQLATNSALGGNGGAGGNGGTGLYNGGNGGPGGDGAPGAGGGICNLGTLTVSNCAFTANSAKGGSGGTGGSGATGGAYTGLDAPGGAGLFGSGGAIYSVNSFTMVNCTLSDNTATGGDSAAGGTLVNGNGTDGPNGADSHGGAICSTDGGWVTNCTIANNKAFGGKGGNGGNSPGWNAGSGGDGGNAAGGGYYNSGTAYLVNCTIAGCGAYGGTNGLGGSDGTSTNTASALDGTMGQGLGGDLASATSHPLWIKNSIVTSSASGRNGAGTIYDGAYNISSDTSIPLLSGLSKKGKNPKLMPLADNGGPGKTMMPQTNSPAIDFVTNNSALPFDERGAPLSGSYRDAGACERLEFSVSGHVLLGTNGLAGVMISATNAGTAVTAGSGEYIVFPSSSPTLLTPTLAGYTFTPPSALVSGSNNVTGVDFAAAAVASIAVTTNGTVQLLFPGTNATALSVQASTNLTNWTVISTNATFPFVDPNQTNFPTRFYRLTR